MTEEEEDEPWRQCEAETPPVYIPVNVILEDGTERLGFWSGSNWIAAGAEVEPVFWRPRVNFRRTEAARTR